MRREIFLILGLVATAFIVMILLSHSSADPSFNNTLDADESEIRNLGGTLGSHLSDLLLSGLGVSAFLIIPMLLLGCLLVYSDREYHDFAVSEFAAKSMGFLLFLLSSAALETLRFHTHGFELPGYPGGIVGFGISTLFIKLAGFQGGTLFLIGTWTIGLCLFSGVSIVNFVQCLGAFLVARVKGCFAALCALPGKFQYEGDGKEGKTPKDKASPTPGREPQEPVFNNVRSAAPKSKPEENSGPAAKSPTLPKIISAAKPEPAKKRRPSQSKRYDLAGAGLLVESPDQSEKIPDEAELAGKSALIENKLKDFGVEVKVVEAHSGPVVTRFEIEPDTGVKGSQIMSLSKDLARSLSVLSIRVLETIEGKSTMGLEIPNVERQTVYLSEIIHSGAFTEHASPLAIALGKDISGYPFVADLRSTPHLLVAGTTGSGKSVSVNAMILSLLFKSSPDEVKMIMIDPKMLELSVYEGIPHLLAPVVTDMEHSRNALEWCVGEMERRYKLMASLGVRSIDSLNETVAKAKETGEPLMNTLEDKDEGLDPLPYIAVVIDELADLMMVQGKKIEGLISRLAQKARASGIHLILATQRPSVDVITGLIKANIPSRVAFQVSSKVDSRTILDQMGAESLLGKGDMLYIPVSAPIPHRIHGAFVSDKEVGLIVKHLKKHYVDEREELDFSRMEAVSDAGDEGEEADADGEKDEVYDQAVEHVLRSQRATISSVQRQLRIGYNRAARIIDSMENAKLISPPDQAGNRKVLVSPPPSD